jgi:transcriptional regulator with XRE-family HTH domain
MPRRETPDPTAKAVGQRIRQLRGERGLTAERLAFESELGSKGFLSDIEKGRASPSLRTLQVIADYLDVPLVDLFTFPDEDERQQLIDRSRWLAPGTIRKLIRDMPRGPHAARGPSAMAKAEGYGARAREPRKLVVAESITIPQPRADRSRRKSASKRRAPA